MDDRVIYIINSSLYVEGLTHNMNTFIYKNEEDAQKEFNDLTKQYLKSISEYKMINVRDLIHNLAEGTKPDIPKEYFFEVNDIASNYFSMRMYDGNDLNENGEPREAGKSFIMELTNRVI